MELLVKGIFGELVLERIIIILVINIRVLEINDCFFRVLLDKYILVIFIFCVFEFKILILGKEYLISYYGLCVY